MATPGVAAESKREVNFDGSYDIVSPGKHEGIWGSVLNISRPSISARANNKLLWKGRISDSTRKGFSITAHFVGDTEGPEGWTGAAEVVGTKLIVTRENNQYAQVFAPARAPHSESDDPEADYDSDSNDSDA